MSRQLQPNQSNPTEDKLNDTTIISPTPKNQQSPPPRGTREYYQWMGRRGGRARAQMPDFAEHQSAAGKRSAEVNDMSALGRRGAQVTMRRYGYAFLFEAVRLWRLQHPSTHEREVAEILNYFNYSYEREAVVIPDRFIAVDFYLPDMGDAIIEVHGPVHTDPRFDHPRREQTRRDLDAHRRRQLERAGFRVLEIDHIELASRFDAQLKIINFLLT